MKLFIFLFATLSSLLTVAQHNNEFYNNGAIVNVQVGAELHVLGDVHMIGASAALTNNGVIKTQGNTYSDNLFQQRGTGLYRIENSDVNSGERQFIQGSFAVRGGQGLIGINDGSFYKLELANDQGIVYLVGSGNVADVRRDVNFSPAGASMNRIITHDIGLTGAITNPANGSSYSGVFGMMNPSPVGTNFISDATSSFGYLSGTDNGYIQGKLRRAISGAGGTYGYIVGLEPAGVLAQRGFQYSHINFDPNNYDVVTGYFESGSSNATTSQVDCGTYVIDYFGGVDHGEWVFDDVSGSGTGDLEVKVWPQDHSLAVSTVFLLTRNNAFDGLTNDCGPTPIGLDRLGFTGLGEFGVAGGSSILPVDLLELNAVGDQNHIDITWSVASELNLSHYEVERSEDGSNFNIISNVDAVGVQGDEHTYSIEDFQARFNTYYYYRIKSIDFDGSIDYSPVVSASIENNSLDLSVENVMVYPNPSYGNFNIALKAKDDFNLELNVINSFGKTISKEALSVSKGNTVITLEAEDWIAGIYFVEFINRDTESKFTKRIIKE